MRASALLLAALVLATALLPAALAGESVPEVTARPVKDKVFYLQTTDLAKTVGSITTRNFFQTTGAASLQEIQSNQRIIAEWYLYPELAGSVMLEGTASLTLWYAASGAGGTPAWDIRFDRVASDGTLTSITASLGLSTTPDTVAFEEKTLTFPVNTVASPLLAGESLRLRVNIRGNAATDYFIRWGDAAFASRLVLPTHDYLRVVPQLEGGIWTSDNLDRPRGNFDPLAANKAMFFYASVTDPFGGYDIVWANLTVRDPSGAVIPALDDVTLAPWTGFFNSFSSVFRLAWDYTGQPQGAFNITVTAVDQTGDFEFAASGSYGVHMETGWGLFSIGEPPLRVWIEVRNVAGASVSGATVEASLGGSPVDSGLTNASGLVEMRLFPGGHGFVVIWTGVVVANVTFAITADVPASSPLVIQAFIISPTLHVVDANGVALANAAVHLQHPNGTVDREARITDASGQITLTLVAAGAYNMSVLWRGAVVATPSTVLDANQVYPITAAVYAVVFTAEDQAGLPVEGAFITVIDPRFSLLLDSVVTGATGQAVSRVPAGTFNVSATYFGRDVYGPLPITVTGNRPETLSLAVFDVTFTVRDNHSVALEGAAVTVYAPDLARVAHTPADGRVSFKLPAGTYGLRVVWRGVTVHDQPGYGVGSGSTAHTATTRVYYLTATTVDREGRALVGTYVSAASGGQVWAANFTDAAGGVTFRLPTGAYTLDAEYRATVGLTDIDHAATASATLDQDRSVVITFSKLPLSAFEQVVTWILLVLAMIVALLLYLIYRKKKPEERSEPSETEPSETKPMEEKPADAPPPTDAPAFPPPAPEAEPAEPSEPSKEVGP